MERALSVNAMIALEVIVESGSRFMRRDDFELRMRRRGCGLRALAAVFKAFERRGWLEASGPVIVLREAAFRLPARPAKRDMLAKQRRMPVLFG